MNVRFDGDVVLVTGAAHGFGRAIALAFADAGANVFAADVAADGLAHTAEMADARGTHVDVAEVDVTRREAVSAWMEGAAERHDRLDVVVNNAGGVLGQTGRPVETVPESDWQAIYAVNVDAAFHTTSVAAPWFKRARSGRIVNIASGAGLGVSLTGIQAYASAKAALIGFTRQMAHELGPWGVTVNAIAPGFVRSNPTTERQWNDLGEEGQANLVDSIALKRLGTAEDIAHGVLFLASTQSAWITGQVLSIDGGHRR